MLAGRVLRQRLLVVLLVDLLVGLVDLLVGLVDLLVDLLLTLTSLEILSPAPRHIFFP